MHRGVAFYTVEDTAGSLLVVSDPATELAPKHCQPVNKESGVTELLSGCADSFRLPDGAALAPLFHHLLQMLAVSLHLRRHT